jgi:hypothetical protein
MRTIGYILGLLWSLPHTLVGLLLVLVYWPRRVRWSDGCLEFVGCRVWGVSNGAQTHGVVVWHTDAQAWDNVPLRIHERVHVLQGFVGGPFYPVAYVLHWLVLFVAGKGEGFGPRWWRAYRAIWFEQQARRIVHEWHAGERPGQWGSNFKTGRIQ